MYTFQNIFFILIVCLMCSCKQHPRFMKEVMKHSQDFTYRIYYSDDNTPYECDIPKDSILYYLNESQFVPGAVYIFMGNQYNLVLINNKDSIKISMVDTLWKINEAVFKSKRALLPHWPKERTDKYKH